MGRPTECSTGSYLLLIHLQLTAFEVNAIGHPRLPYNHWIREDLWLEYWQSSIEVIQRLKLAGQIVSFRRSLILEQCTNLRDLSFGSAMSFPISLSKGVRSVRSERIEPSQLIKWLGKMMKLEMLRSLNYISSKSSAFWSLFQNSRSLLSNSVKRWRRFSCRLSYFRFAQVKQNRV